MPFLQKFFHSIGNFFESLFNAAKKTWNRLSPDVKNAMLKGSGVIELINRNVDKTPDFVLDLIKKQWPDFTMDQLKVALFNVNNALKIADDVEDPDLGVMIANLQNYLKGLKGATWAVVSNMLSNIIAIAIAPAGTKVAAIVQLMEYVYQSFVKKRE